MNLHLPPSISTLGDHPETVATFVVTVDPQGKIIHRVPCEVKYLSEALGPQLSLEMAMIPAGRDERSPRSTLAAAH